MPTYLIMPDISMHSMPVKDTGQVLREKLSLIFC